MFTEKVKLNSVIGVGSSPVWLRSLEDEIFGHRYEEGRKEKKQKGIHVKPIKDTRPIISLVP